MKKIKEEERLPTREVVEKSTIEGVQIFELNKFEDDRGWLIELFRSDCLLKNDYPSMGYVSMTLPGVCRGPHEHFEQSDLFVFMGPGEFKLHLWELRDEDNSYYHHEIHQFGKDNPVVVIVPPGIIHAYKNVSEEQGLVFNFPNRLYAGPGKKYPIDEIRHEESSVSMFQID